MTTTRYMKKAIAIILTMVLISKNNDGYLCCSYALGPILRLVLVLVQAPAPVRIRTKWLIADSR